MQKENRANVAKSSSARENNRVFYLLSLVCYPDKESDDGHPSSITTMVIETSIYFLSTPLLKFVAGSPVPF